MKVLALSEIRALQKCTGQQTIFPVDSKKKHRATFNVQKAVGCRESAASADALSCASFWYSSQPFPASNHHLSFHQLHREGRAAEDGFGLGADVLALAAASVLTAADALALALAVVSGLGAGDALALALAAAVVSGLGAGDALALALAAVLAVGAVDALALAVSRFAVVLPFAFGAG